VTIERNILSPTYNLAEKTGQKHNLRGFLVALDHSIKPWEIPEAFIF
jgi:hypothetical protein